METHDSPDPQSSEDSGASYLTDTMLRVVWKTNDQYSLHPRAGEVFTEALDAVFADPKARPSVELDNLLRLSWIFETKEAFGVADGLLQLIANDDRALLALGINPGGKMRELQKQFARLAGDDDGRSAPVYGEAAPDGSLKAGKLVEGRELEMIAHRKRNPSNF